MENAVFGGVVQGFVMPGSLETTEVFRGTALAAGIFT